MLEESWLESLLVLLAALLSLPLGLFTTLITCLIGQLVRPRYRKPSGLCILVSGDDVRSLILIRHSARAGHRVIHLSRTFSSVDYSNCVFRHYPIQDALSSQGEYERHILEIIQKERVDVFVPCSNKYTLSSNGMLSSIKHKCHIMHFDELTGAKLNRADSFIRAAAFVGLDVPFTELITSANDAAAVINTKQRYVIKSILTNKVVVLPAASQAESLLKLTHLHISPQNPHILQDYMRGSKFCCHTFIWKGTVRTFVAVEQDHKFRHISPLHHDLSTASFLDAEVDLERLRKSRIAQKMQDFVTTFAEKYNLTGHLTITFIANGSEVSPISAKPYIDTSIACFYGSRTIDLAYTRLAHDSNRTNNWPLFPDPASRYCYCGYQELWEALKSCQLGILIRRIIREREYVWDLYDPIPFLVHYHFEVIWGRFCRLTGIY